jgi:hypothetical protein
MVEVVGAWGRIERGGGSEAGVEGGESTSAATGAPQILPPARLLAPPTASSRRGPRRESAGGSWQPRVEGIRLRGGRGPGHRFEAPSWSREAAGGTGAGKRERRPY